ncbi:hypothetical protein ACXLJC_004710 [Escherichia coli]
MRRFRARQREQAREETLPIPPELQKLLTGQLGLLWQAAVQQADADIEQADQERDTALAKVAELESKLAVLLEVQAERDRLLQDIRELRDEMLPLREQVARLTATGEHQAAQLKETKEELKCTREENRALQVELLMLARAEPKGGRGQSDTRN